jgi:alkylation response protein AidB-like acyl-CoA dehydrogenase
MDFTPDEKDIILQDKVRDYSQNILKKAAHALEEKEQFPSAHLKELAKMGCMTVNIPKIYGGLEAGPVALSLALTEVSRGCASTAVIMSVTNMVAEIINIFGTDAQKKKYIPKIASGEYPSGSFSLTEPQAGSDARALKTKAVREGNSYRLNGSKLFVTSGEYSGVTIVYAVTGVNDGKSIISAFLVEKETKGVRVEKKEDKMGLRASNTVSLSFEDAVIPEQNILSKEGDGFKIGMVALDGGRIGIASQALGIAKEAFLTVKECCPDEKEVLAGMSSKLRAAELMTLRAAWRKGQKMNFSTESSMAKLFSTETANEICLTALGLCSKAGDKYYLICEKLLRDVRVTTLYEGTSEIQRMVIARQLLGI